MKLGFVVPTKDRPDDLRKLLSSLALNNPLPHEVVVVDASRIPVETVAREFQQFPVKYLRHLPPCASRQRNAGVAALSPEVDLVGFLDDDTVLEPGAMAAMIAFWTEAAANVSGASFNYKNAPVTGGGWLKHSRLAQRLGIYSGRPGSVSPSGWQTIIAAVSCTTYVDWLCSGASVWRRAVFTRFQFDEYFDGYSYLEDVDFSYSVSRHSRLAIVAGPGFLHFPSPHGRVSGFRFGRIESANRLYLVKKHGLSASRCYAGLLLRSLMSLVTGVKTAKPYYLQRACGNLLGLLPWAP